MSVPRGWRATTLGQLGRYHNGRGFKKAEWRDAGRPIIRIQNLTGSSRAFNYFQGDVEDRYVARPGDLLVSWAATLGAYFWSGPEAVVNQHIFKVESNIDPRFHKYLLDYKLADLMRHTHGSGMVHITRGRFDSEPVNIPTDLDEQRRIVEVLEDHLSRLDAASRGLSDGRRRVVAMWRSALNERIVGPMVKLGSLALSSGYGTSTKCSVDGEGLPVARIPNLVNGQVDMTDEKRAIDPSVDLQSLLLRAGDLLVVRTNGSRDLIGRSAVVEQDMPVAFASYLIRYQLESARVIPRWVHLALETPRVRGVLEGLAASSAGQHNLGLAKLDSVPLPCPSIADQSAALEFLDNVERSCQQLKATIDAAVARSQLLRRTVLAAAFEGKLTGRHTDQEVIEELASV